MSKKPRKVNKPVAPSAPADPPRGYVDIPVRIPLDVMKWAAVIARNAMTTPEIVVAVVLAMHCMREMTNTKG